MTELSELSSGRFARRPWQSPRVPLIAGLVLATLAVIWATHRSRHAPGNDQRGRFGGVPTAVSVATAQRGDIPVWFPALGTVTPLATVTVRTQISGQLQQLAFKEGQQVRKGDFLAQVDPRPYQAALDQALGNLHRDQALLENARVDLQRYQDLLAEDSVSQQQVATQQALVHQYEGTVGTDNGTASAARLNLQYTHITAPIDGRVGLRQVDQGNYVTPGDANGIVVVTQLQPISVIFPLPEDSLPAVQQRLHDGAVLTVEAYDRGNVVHLASGTLQSVDNQIDTATGTVKMRALFSNEDGALFANQFVNIRLLQQVLKDQIIVPVSAVQHGSPGSANATFVYLLGDGHAVAVHPVTLGTIDGERVAVTAGLKAGDIVVTEGGDRLRDGAMVSVPAASHAAVMAGSEAARSPGAAGPNNGRDRTSSRRGKGTHGWPGGISPAP